MLINALREGRYSRSRIAAQLDAFRAPISDLLLPLLDDPDPGVRQWGATLLGRYADSQIELELATLIVDDDPQVRSAVLKSLAGNGSRLAAPAAVTALGDHVWFVRVHAARALGKLGKAELAPEIVTMLATRLSKRGYKVATANDGSSALDIAKRDKPDVVLLDVMMPGKSGWEVARAQAGPRDAGHQDRHGQRDR